MSFFDKMVKDISNIPKDIEKGFNDTVDDVDNTFKKIGGELEDTFKDPLEEIGKTFLFLRKIIEGIIKTCVGLSSIVVSILQLMLEGITIVLKVVNSALETGNEYVLPYAKIMGLSVLIVEILSIIMKENGIEIST
jgi:hypothetical protein